MATRIPGISELSTTDLPVLKPFLPRSSPQLHTSAWLAKGQSINGRNNSNPVHGENPASHALV